MNYQAFAATSTKVSTLCFGAMGLNFAFGNYEKADLFKAMHACVEQGVNMFDTARIYGDSESILGEFLKQVPANKIFVATKVSPGGDELNTGWGIPNPQKLAYPKGATIKSVEASLQALNVERIDLVQLHQYWAQYEDGDWYEELDALKRHGKIKHIGISIPDHRHDQAISIVKSGLIDSVQSIVNIFDPLALDSLVPICQENDVAFIARCVLDEGGLSGTLNASARFDANDFRADYFSADVLEEYLKRVEALKRFIPEYASNLAELALRFAISHPGITTATVSMHVLAHANSNIAAAQKGSLPSDVFEEIRRYDRWLHNLYQHKYFPEIHRKSA
ncbi:aldo/keto reductase [Ningiella sp. W23]|uniref:aldo/keto reductase n=1 Tax=Ningiella sp. W23 TaxID=3023715 RepID=UPI003756B680